jgi:hypothetical protein
MNNAETPKVTPRTVPHDTGNLSGGEVNNGAVGTGPTGTMTKSEAVVPAPKVLKD